MRNLTRFGRAEFFGKAARCVFANTTRRANICAIRAETRHSSVHVAPLGKRRAEHHAWQTGPDHAAVEMQTAGYF